MEVLQRDPSTRWRWVNYSAYDAKSTWDLYWALEAKLRAMGVAGHVDPHVAADFANPAGLAGALRCARCAAGRGRGRGWERRDVWAESRRVEQRRWEGSGPALCCRQLHHAGTPPGDALCRGVNSIPCSLPWAGP